MYIIYVYLYMYIIYIFVYQFAKSAKIIAFVKKIINEILNSLTRMS